MSDTTQIDQRNPQTGRFVAGNSGNGGRRPGARGKLGSLFVEDLHRVWQDVGEDALRRCAAEEPGQFLRVVASLLPRDLNINLDVAVDVQSFAEKYRQAFALLGNPPPKRIPKMPVKVIDHAG
jgi:hypothetical protein